MSRKKSLFLVDVDNTLIDTEGIKSLWRKKFKTRFLQAYAASKSGSGFLNIKALAQALSAKEDFFYNTSFEKFLFPDSREFLKLAKKLGRVIIFSLGDGKFQKLKIAKSGIEKLVGRSNIIISKDKNLDLPLILNKTWEKKYKNIFIIDDRADILRTAKNCNPRVIAVWKYGKKKAGSDNIVNLESDSLTRIGYFLQNFIADVKSSNTDSGFSILRNITSDQIKQLAAFSNRDKKILKFTNDLKRFKDERSFNKWRRQGRTIYTLIDKKQNLSGIIWFCANKYKDFDHTFAIRLYPPARGKGLALPFMRVCIADFNKKRVWLTVRKENLKAIAIYKKFGFSEAEHTSDRTIMTLG